MIVCQCFHFGEILGKFWGGLGWLQASSSFWESLEDVSVFSVRVLPAHLWRELQYLVFTNLN